MDSWLTFSDFNAIYPDSGLTEPQFTQLAADAVFSIMEATHWRANTAADEDSLAQLQACQARLVQLAEGMDTGWDGVTSVSNHGYTESYASGTDQQNYLQQRQRQIIEQTLSAPATRWMLYQGGVYHPPRRR